MASPEPVLCAMAPDESAELSSDTLLIGALYELLWSAEVRISEINRQSPDDRHYLNLNEYFEKKDIAAVATAACFNIDHRVLLLNANLVLMLV